MTDTATLSRPDQQSAVEHFDVLIVGAGISGIGAAHHLADQCPDRSFVILEAQESFGGTWLTHKYPGIRSDSDLYTFGYRFKPWVGPPIATAEEILAYMGEVIAEEGLGRHIRYGHKITAARWSSKDALWTVAGRRTDTGEPVCFTAGFLWMCQGYYRHEEGYTPEWPGMEAFKGRVVHTQTWPSDLELKDKSVIVIGSGATAATLVPAIAGDCGHVTMLQRSPTYFIPARNVNELADTLRELDVDPAWLHEIVRRKLLHDQANLTRRSFEEPETLREELLAGVRAYLPEEQVQAHFMPSYRPWRQRIAFIPDGDLFEGVAAGKASVVTDEIERFDKTGIRLKSGARLDADIVVTATGFNLSVLGDIAFEVDGKPVDFPQTVTWRGMMFTGVPNLAWVFGYFRASWTLRVDIMGDLVCRMLNEMKAKGAKVVEAKLRPEDEGMERLPWIDPENFNPGYLMRAMHLMPKRGPKPEWQHTQNYWAEAQELPKIDFEKDGLVFS